MTHGSLFSGIGGFDLSAQWMGWTNVFQCEKDEWCRRVLAKNFPNVNRYSDIKEFNAKEYEGKIDVISGGFPCQPFSVAGKQLSEEDDRYLWPEMLRIVREVKPPFVVCENVPGIIKLALDTALSDLENEGYTPETFIIPACAKNAWHRRDRVWIIAYNNEIATDTTKQGFQNRGRSSLANAGKKKQELERFRSSTEQLQTFTNSSGAGCEEQCKSVNISQEISGSWFDSWWDVEPGMDRVVSGLPNRMDRIKGLGNAIVPKIAYEIFKAINIIYERKY